MKGMNHGSRGRAAFGKTARLFFCTVAIWVGAGMECGGQGIPKVRQDTSQKLRQNLPQEVRPEKQRGERQNKRRRDRQAENGFADRPADWLEDMLEGMCEEGREEDAAAAYEYFGQLAQDPLNVNRAGRSDLERMMILTDFQIESLLEYRRDHGDILSGAELSLLNGFTEGVVRRLRPFIVFGPGGMRKASGGSFFEKCRSELLAKMRWVPEGEAKPEYLGALYYMQLKYRCTYADKIRLGVTLEKDAGEPFVGPSGIPMGDFFSFHLAFNGIPIGGKKKVILDNLIIGDFSIRFGQGLTFWNSFGLTAPDDPRGFYKKGSAAVPYTSADENNFLRGIAASFSAGRFGLSVAGSYSRRDAAVSGNVYTSLVTGGLHNTPGTLKKRKTLNETVAGLTAHYRFGRFRAGASAILYGYDKKNGRAVREYNKYQMYDGMWGNVSADFYGALGRVRIFGEFALDLGGRPAVLLGALFPAGEKCEAGILARSYSKAYIAPHAGAYHTGSGCFNQSGISVNVAVRMSWNLKLIVNADAVHYPWLRYNIDVPSNAVRGSAKLAYEDRRTSWQIRFADHYQDHSRFNRISLRGRIRRRAGERFLWGCRMEAVFASGKVPSSVKSAGTKSTAAAGASAAGFPGRGLSSRGAGGTFVRNIPVPEAEEAFPVISGAADPETIFSGTVIPEPSVGGPTAFTNTVSGITGFGSAGFEPNASGSTASGAPGPGSIVSVARASGTAASGAGENGGSAGWMVCLEAGYESPGKKFRLAAQGAWFCAPVWDSRLYLYENDLPQTFGSRLLYGKGFRGYLLARYRIFRRTDAYMKLDSTVYSGSGNPAGNSSGKDIGGKNRSGSFRISLGLRLRF